MDNSAWLPTIFFVGTTADKANGKSKYKLLNINLLLIRVMYEIFKCSN